MFEAELKEGIKFRRIIEKLKGIGYVFNLRISETGLLLQSMSLNLDILIQLNLDKSYFDRYICTTTYVILSYIPLLNELIEGIDESYSIKLNYDEASRNLIININNKGKFELF